MRSLRILTTSIMFVSLLTSIQSHLAMMNAKNSGFFLRYSKVLEEIPYSEDNLYGSRVQIPRCSVRNREVSRMKSSIIARHDCT